MTLHNNRPEASPLLGKFFHTFTDKREIEYQGRILAALDNGHFLAQVYEWLMGNPSCMRVFSISQMTAWQIYDTDEEMNDHWERYLKTRRDYSEQ